ncbi:cellulose synthase [Streptomonospora sp. S1-112]|uniref:Cellulose synthase n=1 Tax=Streptomonospora mangrovi TaxID=2883123 RepID=A0A9X3NRF1_9ACTN|nr:cellulose synthase [Streptomonospora mangrovi]MDA0566679.1 cellulose synthase [Streptomonospora mangrovi]
MQEQLPIAGPMLGAALTLVGLLVSWVVWRRRGAAAGLRGIAWSLLPLAAGLMGLMTIAWRLVADLAGFFASLVFNPVVWAGVAVAGLAVVLWVASGVMRSRGVGVRKAAEPPAAGKGRAAAGSLGGGAAAPTGQSAPAPQGRAKPAGAKGGAKGGGKGGADPELDEIEALLRKHGIE